MLTSLPFIQSLEQTWCQAHGVASVLGLLAVSPKTNTDVPVLTLAETFLPGYANHEFYPMEFLGMAPPC